jgi:hypothetical protein
MGSRADSSRLVYRQADIIIAAQSRGSCVKAHPHPNRDVIGPGMTAEGDLGVKCRCQGLTGVCEDNEERVALCRDFHALMLGDRFTKNPVMFPEQFAEGVVAQMLQ